MTFKIQYYTSNGRIFSPDGTEHVADKNGIVKLQINGVEKPFVFSKIVQYLATNITIKPAAPAPVLIKQKERKERKPAKPKPVRAVRGSWRKVPIVAIRKGKELHFESSAAAAEALKVCRTTIPHILSGRQKTLNGYTFKYANS